MQALKKRDLDACRRSIAHDQLINEGRYEIEAETLMLIATQQPMAGDLRTLAAVLIVFFTMTRCTPTVCGQVWSQEERSADMYNKLIINIKPLGFTWETSDPFLFCVHHLDHYPAGNEQLGPAASLAGRNLSQDFNANQSWRMYHGETIPGFPAHPHRGFETVTVVLNGFVDHADSHGAAGRYGNGDVQWMTAGAGLQHAEMFPLLNPHAPNPLEQKR